MADIVAVAVLAVIIFSALCYIIRSKKKGAKCIGCPMAGKCHSKTCR